MAWAQPAGADREAVLRFARDKGWVVRQSSPQHGTIELQAIVRGIPLYYGTTNADAADSIGTDEVLPGGLTGFGLTGSGQTLGVWDAGAVLGTHQELTGRVVQVDGAIGSHDHATHVGGTMVAAGVIPAAKGMSPSALLNAYDWNDDSTEMILAAGSGLRVSNHSYSFLTGWYYDWASGDWFWYGDVNVSETEDYYFGFYDAYAAEWDQIAFDHPNYLIVRSAGNDRNDSPPSGIGHWYFDPATGDWDWSTAPRNGDGNGGYDSITHRGIGKNVLAVGAVLDVPGGYTTPGTVVMTSFSGWGPADDGRIKPDLVANGYQLYSPVDSGFADYDLKSGTSMAAPTVSGSIGLLLEHHQATHPSDPALLASTMKAMLVHTADECGSAPGPDYHFGWGLMNTAAAAQLIADDVGEPLTISEYTLTDGEDFELSILTTVGADELRATIAWTDPPGTSPAPAVDPLDLMLVNDLDLRIDTAPPGTTHLPWTLDGTNPTAPAATGDNMRDNVEQIVVASPGNAAFVLRVSHDGSLASGAQTFSLIVTGAATLLFDCNTNGTPDGQDISGGTSQDCNTNAIPDECDLAAGRSRDCNTNAIPDECEFPDCNTNCLPDDQDLAGGTSPDCNSNGLPDECDIANHTSADCNTNGVPDECDVAAAQSLDCNTNGIPDECDLVSGASLDCNTNGTPDECDVASAQSPDCNTNGIPDDCDLASGASTDCNTNGILDECEFDDCNANCVPDDQDIAGGGSPDCNANAIPGECDIASGYSNDNNGN
ncbi:MAG: S8 family serine peptidase [bacterium]|nr:S8 family serine peptidase [bacterium]